MQVTREGAIKMLAAYIRASYPLPCAFEDNENATNMRKTLHYWCDVAEQKHWDGV